MIRQYAAMLLGAVCIGSVCIGAGALAADDPVVARLNGHEVKLSAVRALLAQLEPAQREQAQKNPQALATIVRGQLGQLALIDEAKQKQWDQRPDIHQKIQQAADMVTASTYLAAAASLPAGYPSEADIHEAYDTNHDQFVTPRQYHLAQIFLATTTGTAEADDKRKADDQAARAKAAPQDFLKSADQAGGVSGSDLGWTNDSRIVPEVLSVVQGMTEGEISDPIPTKSGWHIVKLLGTRPAGIKPLSEVHDIVAAWLRQKKKQEMEQLFLDRLLVKDQAAINEITLKQALDATD